MGLTVTIRIASLVDELAGLPGAKVGHGPRHPSHPDMSLAPRIEEFFDTYPQLRSDGGYVEFQLMYAGASIENADQTQIIDILGFSDAATDIIEMDGPIVDDDGFLVFAQCVYHTIEEGRLLDTYEHDFAFNVATGAGAGIYSTHATLRTDPTPFVRHADNFASWLSELVTLGGYYARPTG